MEKMLFKQIKRTFHTFIAIKATARQNLEQTMVYLWTLSSVKYKHFAGPPRHGA